MPNRTQKNDFYTYSDLTSLCGRLPLRTFIVAMSWSWRDWVPQRRAQNCALRYCHCVDSISGRFIKLRFLSGLSRENVPSSE
jgi:hypothetical protein